MSNFIITKYSSFNLIKENFNEYELINEAKWHWWLLLGALSLNSIFKPYDKYKEWSTKSDIKNLFEKSKRIDYYDIIESAKKKVKNKVLKDETLKNKESILSKIDSIQIIETPQGAGLSSNPGYLNYNEDGLSLEYIIINKKTLDSLPPSYKEMAITHELFHLVDFHRLLQNKPNLNVKRLSESEWYSIAMNILNTDSTISKKYALQNHTFFDKYDKVKVNYLTNNKEIYARLNNFKLFLTKVGELKNPNQDISDKLWEDIYNGKFISRISDKSLIKEFYLSDYLEILPFIKDSEISEVNKLAYISKEKIKNIV